MAYVWTLNDGKNVSLKDFDTRHTAGVVRDVAAREMLALSAELANLQELCYAAAHHAVLIVLQGTDTSGKDGTVSNVMASVDPIGSQVTSFKRPTEIELAHDFLWRIHAHTPARGVFGIFNRSHYEDVLVPRVHALVPEAVWRARYDHINAFERLLVDSNTIVVKFYLHISKEEQAARLAAREAELAKRWKLDAGDYAERLHWDAYQEAYAELLARCGTAYAPWHVVPADRKWFRNLAVARTLVETLRPYRDDWERELHARGERAYQDLVVWRARRIQG